MEVKEVYLDLQRVEKKWKSTFLIEDERFDKPITLKIWYEDNDYKKYDAKVDELKKEFDKYILRERFDSYKDEFLTEIKSQSHNINKLSKDLEYESKLNKKQCEWIKQAKADIKKQNTALEKLNWAIVQLEERITKIEQKLTKQTRIFKDKIFISWNEEVMLGLYDIPDWDYLCITSIEIWEHNEYCENKDGIMIDKIHVEDWFTPRYQLYWGTELDTPTATVYYTLLLMPM